MSAVESLDKARKWARTLEDKEAARAGLSISEARSVVSRKTGVPASKLYSLRRNRLKDNGSWIGRLKAGVIRELEAELMRLNHELQLLRQSGVDPRENQASTVAQDIAAVRLALGLPPEPMPSG